MGSLATLEDGVRNQYLTSTIYTSDASLVSKKCNVNCGYLLFYSSSSCKIMCGVRRRRAPYALERARNRTTPHIVSKEAVTLELS